MAYRHVFFLLALFILALASQAESMRAMAGRKDAFRSRLREEDTSSGMRNTSMHVLSWEPRVLLIKNLIDRKDVQAYIDVAKPKMAASGLSLTREEEGQAHKFKEVRTSEGAFIQAGEDPSGIIAQVELKLAALTGIPRENGESWNVLHYPLGAHYAHHMDYFDPVKFPDVAKNNRLATFLFYLHTPGEGGETIFPHGGENGYKGGALQEYNSCHRGLKVRPEPGDGVLFYSQTSSMILDKLSLHGGCPVTKGEKWVATKWMHNFKMTDVGKEKLEGDTIRFSVEV